MPQKPKTAPKQKTKQRQRILRLDEATISRIAAGEVIERPASAVKELVENAIDAGATRIEIELHNGGRQLIQVTDNGCGMEREEAILALEHHTTSKLKQADDLWHLNTLGFRGEALPSIMAVSNFEIVTNTPAAELGTMIEAKGGYLQKAKTIGAPAGTTIKVQDLFFNTPARFKYLKTIPTETGYITDVLVRLALGYPEISFRLRHHQCELLFTPGDGDLYQAIVALYGKKIARETLPLQYNDSQINISGFIGKPAIARNNRSCEIFFVNRRYFQSRLISAALEKAFHTLLPIARFPWAVIFITLDPTTVDVNAHPSKLEVRFANESDLFKAVYHAVYKTLRDHSLIAEWIAPEVDLTRRMNQQVSSVSGGANLEIGYQDLPAAAPVPGGIKEELTPGLNGSYQTTPQSEAAPNLNQDFYVFPKAVLNTYMIVQDQKGLLFVDQHAAHERVLYERYFHKGNEFLGSQALLIPETVEVAFAKYRAIADYLPLFKDLGFDLEPFGGKTLIVRGVPLTLMNLNYCQIIEDLVEQLVNFNTFKNPSEIKEALIITMACHSSIKAGDSLNLLEMEALVKDLFRCDNPYTCPHGRPTVFRVGFEELTKKFLRR